MEIERKEASGRFWLKGMKGGYNRVTIFSFCFSSLRALRFILLKHSLFVLPHQQSCMQKRENGIVHICLWGFQTVKEHKVNLSEGGREGGRGKGYLFQLGER